MEEQATPIEKLTPDLQDYIKDIIKNDIQNQKEEIRMNQLNADLEMVGLRDVEPDGPQAMLGIERLMQLQQEEQTKIEQLNIMKERFYAYSVYLNNLRN